jgi:transcriptional regulator with XRE-family HTH domain
MTAVKKTEFPPCLTLRKVRTDLGLTQKDLAILVSEHGGEVGSVFISRFECGLQRPWLKARESLAIALGISENELFPELFVDINVVLGVSD